MKYLYVHFPFCETKCHYCDFYSLGREKTSAQDLKIFREGLLREARAQKHLLSSELEAAFFGGGTPSMSSPELMKELMSVLEISSVQEWTMEANPSSVSLERMRAFAAFGVNRVSLGVQSLNDEHLKWLSRVHSRDNALRAIEAVFESGISNVSADLICGIPEQSIADLEEELETLFQFPLKHLSCYLLTLTGPRKKELPDENTQLEHLMFVSNWLRARGFEQYEISNFCQPGFRARHNMNYWKRGSYLGLGPSAHSFDGNKRWKNASSLKLWSKKPLDWDEKLTNEQTALEEKMLALRLRDGFPKSWLPEQLPAELWESIGDQQARLTPRGLFQCDSILASMGRET